MQITTSMVKYSSDVIEFVVFNGFPGEHLLEINLAGEKVECVFFHVDMQSNEVATLEQWLESKQKGAYLDLKKKIAQNR
ncbi:hypothetical protein UFOVP150_60 [uncultured Caudovirales phage]|uniref:Uncharacterized protein n=1 Tax=uncultured Caudovirales phage TaxID=2100421 RepID=A0A6J7W6X2_9CAUD|nr:hypothetical protein UFOVP150_60 [uncultured Caudovirales phage]